MVFVEVAMPLAFQDIKTLRPVLGFRQCLLQLFFLPIVPVVVGLIPRPNRNSAVVAMSVIRLLMPLTEVGSLLLSTALSQIPG